jgi:hypothetical protein
MNGFVSCMPSATKCAVRQILELAGVERATWKVYGGGLEIP